MCSVLRSADKLGSMLGHSSKGGQEMRKQFAVLALGCLTLGFMAARGSAQADKAARPSPRAKGRKIYGGLVPYGEVWRTGANEATTFVTTADVMVGGTHVPAGSYTVFTIPNKDKWTLVISKKTGEWGTAYPGPS